MVSPFAAVTTAAASTLAVFYAAYSLVPLVWADVPGASSLFIGTMMFFVLAVQVFVPPLVRRFSLMWVMLTALFSMVVGILLTGFAGGLPLLVAGAVVLGAGAGTAMVTGAQGVALVLDHQKLARGLGVYGLVAMAASAVGAPVGVQLSLTYSAAVFALCATVILVVAVVVILTLPSGIGLGSSGTRERLTWSSRIRFLVGALSTAPWLIVAFLILCTVVMSHALTSLPVLASAIGSASAVVFAGQLGNAVGRGFGGELGTRAGTSGSVAIAAALIVVGGIIGAVSGSFSGAIASGVVIGVGVGVAQSVTLHAVMLRMTPGRASVMWNLGLDGGLWAGGIMWGLLLTAGQVYAGVLVLAAVVAAAGIAVIVSLRVEDRAQRGVRTLSAE